MWAHCRGALRESVFAGARQTYKLPEVSTEAAVGVKKSAAVPTPLEKPPKVPDELPPASVMTVCAWAR